MRTSWRFWSEELGYLAIISKARPATRMRRHEWWRRRGLRGKICHWLGDFRGNTDFGHRCWRDKWRRMWALVPIVHACYQQNTLQATHERHSVELLKRLGAVCLQNSSLSAPRQTNINNNSTLPKTTRQSPLISIIMKVFSTIIILINRGPWWWGPAMKRRLQIGGQTSGYYLINWLTDEGRK